MFEIETRYQGQPPVIAQKKSKKPESLYASIYSHSIKRLEEFHNLLVNKSRRRIVLGIQWLGIQKEKNGSIAFTPHQVEKTACSMGLTDLG